MIYKIKTNEKDFVLLCIQKLHIHTIINLFIFKMSFTMYLNRWIN